MFSTPAPRVFGLPPGADFPAELARGLRARLPGGDPAALAGVTVFVNSARMRRRVAECLAASGATLLPRLRLITELADDPVLTGPVRPVSALGRRLELAVLVDRLLRAAPGLAPRAALFDLADSLATLMDEMQAEGVRPARIAALDVSEHSAHWARAQAFMGVVGTVLADDMRLDGEARLRHAVEAQARLWRQAPPAGPVILAGSTGSRGTTALLMQAVAGLPQGAVVLPGFDTDLPPPVWQAMDDAMVHESHPQFRLGMLLSALRLRPADVGRWTDMPPPSAARNRLVSLALRPAPVTDQWITEGPGLGDLAGATDQLTLIEALSPRQEALALALVLREAVARGERACLISPDRNLTRRVTAALERWGLVPDDSAGQPLQQSAPGRLLRLTAQALGRRLSVDEVLVLLKHPLAHTGADRGGHLLMVRELELHLRRNGPAFPDAAFLAGWAATRAQAGMAGWGAALGATLAAMAGVGPGPLADLARRHRELTEALARGSVAAEGAGGLWDKEAGAEALAAMEELQREAPEGLILSVTDYAQMLGGVMARREVRSAVLADSRIEILGTQEARIQGAGLVVLGGLTEGSWPAQAVPDPWLNRRLRRDAGLQVPDRRVGLAAHDFQMAIAAPRVVLSRARRTAEAETVPSRWLNRLTNLLSGLPGQGGPEALAAMKARGDAVLDLATRLETAAPVPPAARPAPRPPVEARPRRLSITAIETLITDPYAIYARHVLGLQPLDPLRPEADFRRRGEVVHAVLERFLRTTPLPPRPEDAAALFLRIADEELDRAVPWPVARAEWRGRLERIALPFATATLRRDAVPLLLEEKAGLEFPELGFTLTGKPDRIDLLPDGTVEAIDYKAGSLPTPSDLRTHRKQLHLVAAMVLLGAFPAVGPRVTARITYQSMGPGLDQLAEDLTEDGVRQVLAELALLIGAYQRRDTGYAAHRIPPKKDFAGDYDHLSRRGEWTVASPASPEDVG